MRVKVYEGIGRAKHHRLTLVTHERFNGMPSLNGPAPLNLTQALKSAGFKHGDEIELCLVPKPRPVDLTKITDYE